MSGEWSLTALYPSYDSAEYKTDMSRLEEVYQALANIELVDDLATVKNVIDYLEQESVLLQKLHAFSALQLSVNTTDAQSLQEEGRLNKLISENAKTNAKIMKFLGKTTLSVEQEPSLAHYKFFFDNLKKNAQHILSEEVEEVIALMDLNAGSAWGKMKEFLGSTVETEFKGESLTLSEIRNLAYDADQSVRKSAYEAELAMYAKIKEPVAFSLNYIKSQVNDVARLRGYDSPLAQTLEASVMSRATLDALLEAIRDSLPAFRRYLQHKATLLGHQNGLPFYDLFAPMGEGSARTFTLEASKDFLLEHFAKFSPDLAEMTAQFFDENFMDIYPRKGKVGGAFCHNLPVLKQSRIMLNFDGSLSSVVTTAHELGHAYHGLHIEDHAPLNWDYSMPVAETASTFNEALVMSPIIAQASDDEKASLLEAELQDTTQIIVDIYSRFLFEDAVFNQRHDKFLFAEDLAQLMLNAQKEAYGDGLDPDYLHPYMWICKPHYYSSGLSYYNFPYAFGGLFSKGLYAMYQEQPEGFVEKYQAMLKATTVSTVEETAAKMGIDTTDKAFWAKGLQQIERQIDQWIALTSK